MPYEPTHTVGKKTELVRKGETSTQDSEPEQPDNQLTGGPNHLHL